LTPDVSAVRAASIIALFMEAARTSETSFDIQLRTRQYIREDSELHTRRRENLNLTLYHTLSCQEEWMKTAKKIGTNRNST
jgi:hypothetical protein